MHPPNIVEPSPEAMNGSLLVLVLVLVLALVAAAVVVDMISIE